MGTPTTNYDLIKDDLNDNYSIEKVNANLDKVDSQMKANAEAEAAHEADYTLQIPYGITGGTVNAKTVLLNPPLLSYVEGVALSVKINLTNTGATTLNVNGLGDKAIVDGKGNALTGNKLIANSIYTFRYNGTSFQLQGEGGEYGTALATDVLSGKTIGTNDGLVIGTISSKALATITPSTVNQIIAAGQYLSGAQTVLGDADLISTNIKAGANIFGVAGSVNVVDTAAATILATDILSGKTGYKAGALITGNIPSKGAATITPSTVNQTIAAGQYLSGVQTIAGDAELLAANIVGGANIFNVAGSAIDGSTMKKVAYGTLPLADNTHVFTVNNLTFLPTFILVYTQALYGGDDYRIACIYSSGNTPFLNANLSFWANEGDAGRYAGTPVTPFSSITSTGFICSFMNYTVNSITVYWVAIS